LVLEQGVSVARAGRILKTKPSISKKRVQEERARRLQGEIKTEEESVKVEIDCGAPFAVDLSAASEYPLLIFCRSYSHPWCLASGIIQPDLHFI
jgi:hypothetical protein